MAEGPKEFRIDGEPYTLDDLTFKELKEHRQMVRESAGDPDLDVSMADMIDFYPPLIYLIRRRSNADYSLDEAQSGKIQDHFFDSKKRPTKAAPKA